MCLARSTPHTGGSGAQGLWSVIHSQTTSEPLPKGDGPRPENSPRKKCKPLIVQYACGHRRCGHQRAGVRATNCRARAKRRFERLRMGARSRWSYRWVAAVKIWSLC